MPKIIENVKQKLMDETRRQIAECGYDAVTVRSVAKACEIGIGTVYNYFPSKDALIAAYMLSDWNECISSIELVSNVVASPEPVSFCIYNQLIQFAQKHQDIIQNKSAVSSFHNSSSRYHGMLRQQLAKPLERFCENMFTAEFIAEAFLTWTFENKSFDEIWNILKKCF